MSTSGEKLLVSCPGETDLSHPHCPHGPTLLFYDRLKGTQEGYFSCSAYRSKAKCSFHVAVSQLTDAKLKRHYEVDVGAIEVGRQMKIALKKGSKKCFHYCNDCGRPFFDPESQEHSAHSTQKRLGPELFEKPVDFLPPVSDEKGQAQYFFDEKALQFFRKCFNDLGIRKVVCMGAPKLHQYIGTHCPELKSFLLDFDRRFLYFFDETQFAWYNMCNNYFFADSQEKSFSQFLKCGEDEKLLLFTDPPFACRTEAIAHTLHSLTSLFNDINHLPHQPLPVFWIFPYYMEVYVRQAMPQLEMSDYKVNYTNHISYTDVGVKCRKMGSPVRLFSNVPHELLHLPVAEGYKYCAACKRYTALENRHCKLCKACPSKNGSSYRHCSHCARCVKSYYVHCKQCRRCTQTEGHSCDDYQKQQHCWICRDKGHTEPNCTRWLDHCDPKGNSMPRKWAKKKGCCLLCGCQGHNERVCKQRARYIRDTDFLGERQVHFL